MFLVYATGILNAKIVLFGMDPLKRALEVAQASPPESRITMEKGEDGGVVVLEPKQLRHFTPRFHLTFSGLAQFHEPTRVDLFRGADGLVLCLPGEASFTGRRGEFIQQARQAMAEAGVDENELPIVVEVTGASSSAALDAVKAELGMPGNPRLVVRAAGAPLELVHAACDLVTAHVAQTSAHLDWASELAAYPGLPFKSPGANVAQAPIRELQVPRKVSLGVLAVAVAFVLLAVLRAVACR